MIQVFMVRYIFETIIYQCLTYKNTYSNTSLNLFKTEINLIDVILKGNMIVR